MRISDWSSDVCSSDLVTKVIRTGQWAQGALRQVVSEHVRRFEMMDDAYLRERASDVKDIGRRLLSYLQEARQQTLTYPDKTILVSEELSPALLRSEEHTSELQSLMRISYAVFCLIQKILSCFIFMVS